MNAIASASRLFVGAMAIVIPSVLAERQYSHFPADFCGCSNHNGDDRPHVPKQFVKRPRPERFATFGQGRELPQQATLAHEDRASLRWIKTVASKCRVGVYEVLAECSGRAAWPRITSIPYKR